MRILCTFPGRAGDLLWALPTVRALAEREGEPVHLQIAGEFAAIAPLLAQQPYLASVCADQSWSMHERVAPSCGWGWDQVITLGYDGWPKQPLPFDVAERAGVKIDLDRPWIQIADAGRPLEVAVGFTEAWFELKLGLLLSLERQFGGLGPALTQLTIPGSRWTTEVLPGTIAVDATDWCQAAAAIRNSDLFFGDCSALHVLAVALGKKVVVMEPMEGRWNPIFWPLGKAGRVQLVLGNDGQPTFDARTCADAIREALQ